MRADAVGVLQRDEHVVVDLDAGAAAVDLRVDLRDRAEQLQRLVDDVRAQVVEQAAGLGRVAELAPVVLGLGHPAVVAGLEAEHLAELPGIEDLPDGEEVGVEAPVLEDRQADARRLRRGDDLLGLERGRRERLVDDHRQAGLDRPQRERHVRAVRRADHDEVEVAGPLEQRVGVRHDLRARGGRCAPGRRCPTS